MELMEIRAIIIVAVYQRMNPSSNKLRDLLRERVPPSAPWFGMKN